MTGSRKSVGRAVACVLGDLDLMRPLSLADIPCAIVAPRDSILARSRFARAVIPWNDEDISENAQSLLERLLQFAAVQPSPPVLFYQEDEQLLFVSRHRTRLSQGFRFVIPDADLVESLVDKAHFHALADRLNLPVPATQRMQPEVGSPPATLDLRFPIIVKPLRRRRSWAECGYSAKAIQIDTPSALQAWWPHWAQQGLDLIAQEQVPGPESRIESYHVYADAAGDVIAEFAGRKIRTLPPALGHSTALETTDAADVIALGRSLVRTIGLCGVAKFDFKRAPDGTLFLLEVNPRFNLWHHLGAVAGVNLPAIVYGDLTGLPRPAATQQARANVQWCRLSDDWRAAKASGINLRSWLLWATRCEAKSMTWRDPLPIVETAWRLIGNRVAWLRRESAQQIERARAAGI